MKRSALAPVQIAALKTATQALIQEVGGLDAAASVCRLGASSLSDCQSRQHPERMLPIDVVMEMEARAGAGVSPVSEALARARHCVLVPVEALGANDLAVRLAQLGREVGDVFAAYAEALADGRLTDAERESLGKELVDVIQAGQRALGALGVAHGVRAVGA